MTVRLKITLLITAAGFLSSLVLSIFTLVEMLEQPLDLIDAELKAMARRAAQNTAAAHAPGNTDLLPLLDQEHYWLQISAQNSEEVLYRSALAQKLAIPAPPAGKKKAIRRIEVPDSLDFDQDDRGRVAFRILCSPTLFKGKAAQVCVARPIEELQDELWDTVEDVAGTLALSTLLLLGASYVAAALILKPVKLLNAQARDISERHLERRLPVRAQAKDEFNTLATTLNRVFDRLQHAFLRQKRLIADASHELKTPLTMMHLALDSAQENLSEQDEAQTQNLERMTVQVLRMERLVKNILDLSSLEAESQIHHEELNLSAILASLLTDYRAMAEPRGISIEATMPDQVLIRGDAEKLYRAFSNLLDNAVKYNVEGGGEVVLTIRKSPLAVAITISNTGPAIPVADQEKVFEQFYRVDKSRSLKHGGSGLGLAIVKRIIELHGGTVRLERGEEERTTVAIILPSSPETKTNQ